MMVTVSPPFVEFHVVAAFPEQVRHYGHMLFTNAPQGHAVPHHGRSHHESTRFNAVRNDGMVAAAEFLNPVNDDPARSGALDAGAHLDQKVCQIHHFRFGSGGFNDGGAFRQHGGHHQVVRSQDGGPVVAA